MTSTAVRRTPRNSGGMNHFTTVSNTSDRRTAYYHLLLKPSHIIFFLLFSLHNLQNRALTAYPARSRTAWSRFPHSCLDYTTPMFRLPLVCYMGYYDLSVALRLRYGPGYKGCVRNHGSSWSYN